MATDLTAGGFYAVIPAPVLKDPHLRPRTKRLPIWDEQPALGMGRLLNQIKGW